MAKRRAHRDPHYWVTSQGALWCAYGSHRVVSGSRLRYRSGDHRQLGSCEDCLKRAGVVPGRRVTMAGDEDVRAKRAGGDE